MLPKEPQFLQTYADLRSALVSVFDALRDIAGPGQAPSPALRERLAEDRFTLLTVGQFNRGKTCLVNALLGEDLLPTGIVPLTSIPTVIVYGRELSVTVRFTDGRLCAVDRDGLSGYVTETGNPGNAKGVADVCIGFPSPLLENGVRLVDTPGVGSVHRYTTDITYRELLNCDAALFVLSADQPLGQAELEFLHDVKGHAQRIFFLLNKIDYLDGPRLDEALAFSGRVLCETMGTEPRLFPVSARLALQAQSSPDARLLQQSHFDAFKQALQSFLLQEKGKVLLLSAGQALSQALLQVRLETQLAQASMLLPTDTLDTRIEEFTARVQELIVEKRRLRAHLRAEAERLIKTLLDPELRRFRQEFTLRAAADFERFLTARAHLSLGDLDEALKEFVDEEVRTGFSAFAAEAEGRLDGELEALERESGTRIDALISDLQRFSADLFGLPHECSEAEPSLVRSYKVRLDSRSEPVGLELLTTTAAVDWPRYLSHRLGGIKGTVTRWANARIAARRRRQLADAIDRHAGRVRDWLIDRIEVRRERLAERSVARLDAIAEGLGRALEASRAARRDAAGELEERRRSLDQRRARLDAIQTDLDAIRREVERL